MKPPCQPNIPDESGKSQDPDLVRFGANLRQLRDDAGMSREELAKHLGATRKQIENWETGGSNPDVRYINRAATLFNVSRDELLGHDPEQPFDDAVTATLRYIRHMLTTVEGRVGFTINVQPQGIGQQINFQRDLSRPTTKTDPGNSSGNSFREQRAT